MLFALITAPAVWRLCLNGQSKFKFPIALTNPRTSYLIIFASLVLCLSSTWLITAFIFPSLATVDLRLPELILYSLWSMISLPILITRYVPSVWLQRIKKPSLIFLSLTIMGSLFQASILKPTQALRIQRDTSLSSVLLDALGSLSDSDGDKVGDYWGHGDCDDANPQIRPGTPDQHMQADLNCNHYTSGLAPLRSPFEHSPLSQPSRMSDSSLPRPKNLILLTVDALRYDAYLKAMPETRRFAEKALDFTNAYSAGAATYWSIPALLGSRPPSFFKMGPDQTPVNPERLLTESLRDAQFHTALFANVTIFFVRGLSQGAYTKNYDTSHYTVHGAKPGAAHLTNGLIKHIDLWQSGKLKPHRERFMLWGHYYDPHDPYFEIDGQSGGSDHDRYLKIVSSVDRELGRLFKALKDRQLLENTMVVITADHGDEFGDHGHRFHGKTLYDEMVKVPLVIYSPQYNGREVSEVFSHLDVAPTILSHLGLKREDRFMGHDWDQELREQRTLEGSQAFFEVLPDSNYAHHLVGIRRGNHKLIAHVDRGAFEHYQLNDDPKELKNLALTSTDSDLSRSLIGYIEHQLRQLSRGEARVKLP